MIMMSMEIMSLDNIWNRKQNWSEWFYFGLYIEMYLFLSVSTLGFAVQCTYVLYFACKILTHLRLRS